MTEGLYDTFLNLKPVLILIILLLEQHNEYTTYLYL